MFDLERFIADCIGALGEPEEAGFQTLYHGGDFFAPGRSEWDPETLEEWPFDIERARRTFKNANARFDNMDR